MYKVSDFGKSLYKAGEVANILGVTLATLHNYDKAGVIKFIRSEGGHRLVEREELVSFLTKKGLVYDDTDVIQKRDVVYARVSSHEQKTKGDLDRQAVKVLELADDLQSPLVLKEVGSGLNDKRKQLLKLIDMVMKDEVNNVYVTYRDRLTRFGFNYLERVFNAKGVKIIVMCKKKDKDTQQELVDDMMSLIASFSGKLYGMRSGKNKRRKENEEDS